jgi:type II secretory pathway pseudopilin PulG
MTLVELMIVIGILATVILALTSILLSTSRVQSRTVRRAGLQADSRQALSLMTNEIRQAGLDPGDPVIGVVGIVAAQDSMIHVRANLNGDGAIQTTEPSEDITYCYDPAQDVITRDPGSGPAVVLANVTGMSFSYFDSANQPVTPLPLNATDAARVHSVGLTITCVDHDSQPLTLATRITLRNM